MIAGSTLESRFAPTSIAGLLQWTDGDTGSVSSWTDQSGNGNHFLQASGTLQPTISTTCPNGHKAYLFDGSNDMMAATYTLAEPYTVIITYRIVTLTASGVHDIIFETNSGARNLLHCNDPVVQMTGPINYLTLVDVGPYRVFSCVYSGASSLLRINSSQRATGTSTGAGALAGMTLGAQAAGTRSSNIAVANFMVYNTALSSANLLAAETYCKIRYSL